MICYVLQLVDQNQKLSAQCESLVQAMKSTDQKYTRKISDMEERLVVMS